MLPDHEIEDYLDEAELFFHTNGPDVLIPVCADINREQPQFTPIAYSWHGLTGDQVEILFETILVLYYALRNLANIRFPTFQRLTLMNNIEAFASFIRYYNLEAVSGQADPDVIRFIENPVLLNYSASCLSMVGSDLPKETMASYMSVVKAIDDHLLKLGRSGQKSQM